MSETIFIYRDMMVFFFFFSSRRRHTRCGRDWSSDVCSSDLHIKRVSTPGRRVYRKAKEMKPVLGGMGITIVSTSSGIYSDREARQKNIGGEVLCEIY